MDTQSGGYLAQLPSGRGVVLSQHCPSRDVMKHINSNWSVLVFAVLSKGTHRFSELRRKIEGVSERMLTHTLKLLVEDGFVDRVAHPVVPPHVEYSLTPLGRELALKIGDLIEWIEVNYPRIAEARQKIAEAK